MAKSTLEKILILGALLEVRIIDPNDPEIKRRIEETKKAQAVIMEQKERDSSRYPYA